MPGQQSSRVPEDYRNPDRGTQVVVEVLQAGELLAPYWLCLHLARQRGRWRSVGQGFAYPYIAVWSLLLVGALASSRFWATSWQLSFAPVFLAAWRLFDITRWWIDFVVDRRHQLVVSRERNLIFLGLNLVESAFIGAIFFRATGVSGTASHAWFDSFFEITQLSLPAGSHSTALLAKAVVEVTALVLILGGLAALLDAVSGKIVEGPWEGPQPGAAVPGWPWSWPKWLARCCPSPWTQRERERKT
jgi:hypothetical protein